MGTTLIYGLSIALLIAAPACTKPMSAAEFDAGMSRQEVIDRFGEPDRRQTIVKRDEAIWGAIEDFWQQVPTDSTVLIWTYPVDGGSVELYFIGESMTVDGVGFAPEGAVFESTDASS